MKRVILCADDYGIAPGVSAAIRELVRDGRLNATSVMTVFPDLQAEADALLAARRDPAVSIGLHVTLTGPIAPLTRAGWGETFSPLKRLLSDALLRRLDLAVVAREVEAQFVAFEDAFGRPPDHVDGHQHVHVLPGIRSVVIEKTRRFAPSAWLRDVTPAPSALGGFDPKARLIGAFGRGFARQAAAAGLATSGRFAGAYDFAAGEDFAGLMARFLKGAPEGGVVMVHPGRVDAALGARDPLTGRREEELAVLASPVLPQILAQAGARLF